MESIELNERQSRAGTEGTPSTNSNTNANTNSGDVDKETGASREAETRTKKDIWKYRAKLIAGLFLPFFLDAIDTTIISTALPHIASDFSQLSQQSWIVTSFALTATAFIPAFGQLCDLFGRHTILQFALVLMWIGSALCAGAQTFWMLLLGRGIAGVSSSGLLVVTTVALGDKVSLKESAIQHTLFGLVAGISYGVGPVIGGQLTKINWRWCFGLSIPVALLAQVLAFFFLRPELVKAEAEKVLTRSMSGQTVVFHSSRSFVQKLAIIDWEGLSVFLIACICLLLALTWGGSTYAWNSPQIIILLILGGLLIVLFLAIEKGMEDDGWLKNCGGGKNGIWGKRRAMIPLSLFSSKDICILAYINFTGGVAVFSMFYFISVYFVLVENYSAEKAGVQLLFFLPGLGAGAYAAMYLCNIQPAQTFPPILLGQTAIPIAIGILSHALTTRNEKLIFGMMALCGFGAGITYMPVPLHAIARKPKQLAVVISTLQFFEPFGGTVALAIMGSVLNNKIAGSGIGAYLKAPEGAKGNEGVLQSIDGLPNDVELLVRTAVKVGVRWAFIAILPFAVLAAYLTLGLGNVKIDSRGLEDRIGEQEENEAKEEQDRKGGRSPEDMDEGKNGREKLAIKGFLEEVQAVGITKILIGFVKWLLWIK